MSKRAENTIASLLALAVFTPIFSGYVLGFSMLLLELLSPISGGEARDRDMFNRLAKPVGGGFRIMWLCLLLAAIGTIWFSPEFSWRAWKSAMGNYTVKYVLLWFALHRYWRRHFQNDGIVSTYSSVLAVASVVHFIYCLAQRKYGFDWAHGFSAQLGPGRFAYGVYRVSGFMGHPLTLGYCQAIMMVSATGLALSSHDRKEKISWSVTGLMAALVLLISGSRGPLLIAAVCGIAQLPVYVWKKYWRYVCGVMIVFAGIFVASGAWHRYLEILSASGGGDARMTHWKVFFRIFMENKLIGLGPGTPREAISAYYRELGSNDNIMLAHNAFLQFAAEFGLVGALGAVMMVRGCLITASLMTSLKASTRAVTGVVVLGALTQNNLQDSQFVFALMMWLSVFCVYEVKLGNVQSGRYKNDNILAGKSGENIDPSR